jgi:hypothetical protein
MPSIFRNPGRCVSVCHARPHTAESKITATLAEQFLETKDGGRKESKEALRLFTFSKCRRENKKGARVSPASNFPKGPIVAPRSRKVVALTWLRLVGRMAQRTEDINLENYSHLKKKEKQQEGKKERRGSECLGAWRRKLRQPQNANAA